MPEKNASKPSATKRIISWIATRWVVSGLGAIAVALLLWFVAPLISIFTGEPARLALVALVAICWLVANLVLDLRAARRNAQMVAQVTDGPAGERSRFGGDGGEEETLVLRERLQEALAELKRSQSGDRGGKQYLYQLPWYVLIGPPGSGKTTALINSGLRFPLSNKFGRDPLRGVGGTRNCDWWFSDDAILLDTAGRYTTQDSNQSADLQAWLGFLRLLKQYRPRQPVNGVVVAIGIPDLLQMSAAERAKHARAIRNRLAELQQEFGMRLPVYVVFTKADRLAGFTEFFDDLDRQGRMDVWGATFPLDRSRNAEDLVPGFDKEFDMLVQRLNGRLLERVQEERDPDRRARLFGFPLQFSTLKSLLHDFLSETFETTRFEDRSLLRGTYFTSANSGGHTDRPADGRNGTRLRAV